MPPTSPSSLCLRTAGVSIKDVEGILSWREQQKTFDMVQTRREKLSEKWILILQNPFERLAVIIDKSLLWSLCGLFELLFITIQETLICTRGKKATDWLQSLSPAYVSNLTSHSSAAWTHISLSPYPCTPCLPPKIVWNVSHPSSPLSTPVPFPNLLGASKSHEISLNTKLILYIKYICTHIYTYRQHTYLYCMCVYICHFTRQLKTIMNSDRQSNIMVLK